MRRPTMTFSLRLPQVVDSAGDGGFGEDARGLLEGGGGDEGLRRERGFGDAEEQGHAVGGLAATVHDLFVLFHEAEAIDLLVHEEVRVAHARDADAAQHLAADDFDVLVVDGDGLRAVDLLDLVDQVALQLFDAEDCQDVVRGDRVVDERGAGAARCISCTLTCTERGTLYSWRVPSSISTISGGRLVLAHAFLGRTRPYLGDSLLP